MNSSGLLDGVSPDRLGKCLNYTQLKLAFHPVTRSMNWSNVKS